MTKAAKKIGRPSLYSEAVSDAICARLARGEPLARICDDPDMPHFGTVWRWEKEHEEFRELSARAREIGTHYIADDCLRIVDDPGLEPADKRVRVDTRIRLIGKWNAKNYGEKITQEHTGPNGAPLDTGMGLEAGARLAAILEEARARRDEG